MHFLDMSEREQNEIKAERMLARDGFTIRIAICEYLLDMRRKHLDGAQDAVMLIMER
jgi:hypothetical protein